MKARLDYAKRWWMANSKNFGKLFFVVLIGLLMMFFVDQSRAQTESETSQNEHAQSQTKILQELAKQAKSRNDNVNKLIQDNAEQTLILCTIILRDNNTLTADEKTSIEAICHEQITEISGGLSDASGSGTASGTAQSGQGNQASSPNSTTENTTPQANNPQPTPVIPVVPIPATPNCTIDILFIHVGKCN